MTCTYITNAAAQIAYTVVVNTAYILFTAPALKIFIGGFKMKQVICDICGKIINHEYALINFPYKFGGYIIQSHDEDDAHDVCQKCALEYYELTEKFKKDKRGGERK